MSIFEVLIITIIGILASFALTIYNRWSLVIAGVNSLICVASIFTYMIFNRLII